MFETLHCDVTLQFIAVRYVYTQNLPDKMSICHSVGIFFKRVVQTPVIKIEKVTGKVQ